MKQLCQIIQTNGQQQNGAIAITFGDLFEVYYIYIFFKKIFLILYSFQIYTNISDKLVGILLKARKHGYLTFQGEMLLQNRDENVLIRLIHSP